MFGIDHLLSPLTVEEFINDYRGKRAVHIPGEATKFPDIYAWEQINDQINFSRPSREGIRLIYQKQPLEHRELAKLAEWMVKGATLVINRVQEVDPILSRFATNLGGDLNALVNINCYASYPAKQGFDTHYDGHDVFVVHTAGEKSWQVAEPTRLHPLDIDRLDKGKPPETSPYLNVKMTPGDVLYIPRGHWHAAVADTPSVHLTVSNTQRSGIDFLHWITEQLKIDDDFLRQDFPVIQSAALGGQRPDDTFEKHLTRFREHMTELLQSPEITDSFKQFCMVGNPVPRNFQLPDLAQMREQLTPETRFRMTADQKIVTGFTNQLGKTELMVRGHLIKLTDVGSPIVEILQNSTISDLTFSGAELQNSSHSTPWEKIQELLLFLFEQGLTELA